MVGAHESCLRSYDGASSHEQWKSHFSADCEKARAVVRELLSFGDFFLDGISRSQLAISMWLGARGASM
jgi:hypothetical protein